MSDQSPNLQLPYIIPDQAQKHVTHNEAIQRLDGLIQLSLVDIVASPPANAVAGAAYAVAGGASGNWLGHDGEVALFQDGFWMFTRPKRGWLAWLESRSRTVCHDGTAWIDLRLPPTQQTDMLGINTAPDSANRFALSSPASLFNHAGAGHQLKLNKANDAATASLLLQSGYSGRAEIGLAGDNDLSFKVSPDGNAWNAGLMIDSAGIPRMPNRPACRASLNVAAQSITVPSYSGFQVISVNQGRFSLGTPVPTPGTGQRLIVPAAGLYLVSLTVVTVTSSGNTVSLMQNASRPILTVKANNSTATLFMTGTTLALLEAGDTLLLQHAGTANIEFGPGKTELMIFML